jgi:phosphoenolpyruvate carboxylase
MAWQADRPEEPLSRDIHLLGDILGEVIVALEGQELFDLEERVRSISKARRRGQAAEELTSLIQAQPSTMLVGLVKCFSNYFQLVNLAEDAQRVRVLRERELQGSTVAESLEDAVLAIQNAGLDRDALGEHLGGSAIRLVFTAHPTEAKRSVVLAKLREIGRALERLDNPRLLQRERRRLVDAIRSSVVALWQTRVARPEKPSILDEVYHGLYFLINTVIEVLPELLEDFAELVRTHLGLADYRPRPYLRFGTWIGGDRDGHPDVTPEVTIATLDLMRSAAQNYYLAAVERLSEQLSQSLDEVEISDELGRSLAVESAAAPELAGDLQSRYKDEPYRQKLGFVASRLRRGSYRSGDELLGDLRAMATSLEANGAMSVSAVSLGRLIRQVEAFGLTLATMDIRQEASRHHNAIAEILSANGRVDYGELDSGARADLLDDVIKSPTIKTFLELAPEASDTWESCRAIHQAHQTFGKSCIDAYVISLTRNASDVLAVQLLLTLAEVASDLDIVPLFETREDLRAAPGVLEDLFSRPVYKKHLMARGNKQQVMIGYSDSNKDTGYLPANWELYRAQREIADVCNRHGVMPEFFHGRGGTTARGGGPLNRAILGQPGGTVRGRLKVTEQGETIAERYANRDIAYRHLSQVVNAVIKASLKPRIELSPALVETMTLAGEAARAAYIDLVRDERFSEYFHQATPIDEISRLTIGSRPARRPSGAAGIDNLRAIPWVFAWMQCRANIPGWYGLGSGLATAAASGADLNAAHRDWDFFRAVIDNAQMALAKTDLAIASLYTELVAERELRERIFAMISSEYERTLAVVLQTTGQTVLLESSPELRLSIEQRNPYVDPLNYLQVELLRRFRTTEEGSPEHARLRAGILQTINGIAAGMKNTG